jgi:hypothetical protein
MLTGAHVGAELGGQMTDTDPILERRAGYLALAAEYRALAKSGKSVGLTAAFIKIAEGYESLADSIAREAARRHCSSDTSSAC